MEKRVNRPGSFRVRLLGPRPGREGSWPAGSLALCFVFLVAATALASGCVNNLFQGANDLSSGSLGAGTDGSQNNGDNASGMVLVKVQRNAKDPAGTLDLVGDGTGAMGSFCLPSSTSGSGTGGDGVGASTCTCVYTYIDPATGSQIGPLEVDTTYYEKDLLRCTNTVPSDVPYFDVSVHITQISANSSTFTFRQNVASGAFDSSNPANFAKVQRYQCRDIVSIKYPWDENVYDPISSEDPRYSYPLNFYTTNMGKTMALYAGGDGKAGIAPVKGWICPPIPNDNTAGLDLTLYSVAADSSGSKSVYPPSGSFDRSTFFAAKTKSSTFSVPINAVIAPGIITTTQPDPAPSATPTAATGVAPIGYAVRPSALSGGGEACPGTSTPIPQGYHWAKLWLFRKQLPRRTYPMSAKLYQLGPISCNSRPWSISPPSAPYDTAFTDCSGQPHIGNLSGGLAARFFEGTGMCSRLYPGNSTDASTLAQQPGFEAYLPGTDIYAPSNRDPKYGCTGNQKNDPAGICSSATGNVAYDSSSPVVYGQIDSLANGPRFDYLFVVTPVSVHRADMDPSSLSTTHQVYTPVRYISPGDCKSPDPDNPSTPGDCKTSRQLRYELKKHEIGSSGNPAEDDPNRPGDFPLCVLQPN